VDARFDKDNAASADALGDSTPTSSPRAGSPLPPPPVPRVRRARGSAPVCVDFVEVYTVGGEHTQIDATKGITTGDLRFAVATRRGVAASQVQLFCDKQEISDDTPVLSEQLSVVLRHASEPPAFPAML